MVQRMVSPTNRWRFWKSAVSPRPGRSSIRSWRSFAPRSVEHQVRTDGAERSLLSRDASVFRGGVAGPVCFPESTDDVQACMRIATRARTCGRAAWRGHRPGRRRGAARGTDRRRDHQDEPHPRGRPRRPRRLGRARRDQPRPHRARCAARASTSPPTRPPSSRARSAATWPTTPAARTAWPTASPAPTSSPSRWCCPTAQIAVLGGLDPEPAGYDLRGVFVGSEGTLGIATRIAVRLTPNPPAVRTLLADFVDPCATRPPRCPPSSPPAWCRPPSR